MTDETGKIIVVDSEMGSGKTTFALQYIQQNPDKSFVFCTPFLDEVERVKSACHGFIDPKRIDGRKINGFNSLLEAGENIVLTHATFSNANDETLQRIREGHYVLVLDEVLDILLDFNEVAEAKIKRGDIDVLLNEGFIKVDNYGRVSWVKGHYPGSTYVDVERLAKNGVLFYLDKSLLVWQLPPEIFRTFDQIFILTFMFQGSFLKPYFEYHGLLYTMRSVYRDAKGGYYLDEYRDMSRQRKAEIRQLISLYDPHSTKYKAGSGSKSWFRRATPSDLKDLQKRICNYIKNVTKAKTAEIMWTAPKDFAKYLKGGGYVRRSLTDNEKRQLEHADADTAKRIKDKAECFVPCNARASNNYRDRRVLIYAVNLYVNPYVSRYFENRNQTDHTDIHVDEEAFALQAMLQWIWRACIRDGKPIELYVPFKRMRDLLTAWLDG